MDDDSLLRIMTQLSFWAIRAWEYLLFWILYWGDTTLGDSGSDILSIELSRMQIDDAAKEKLMETSLLLGLYCMGYLLLL